MDEEHEKQTTEVRETNEQRGNTNVTRQSVETSRSIDSGIIAKRIVYYLAGVIIAFLALRMVLLLLAANQGSAFVDFVYTLGGFFAWPFFGVFSYEPTYGQSVFEISSLVAIIVYALIAWGLGRLFTLSKQDEV